jgi:hypothetical protein
MSEFEERRILVSTTRTVSGDDRVDGFFRCTRGVS